MKFRMGTNPAHAVKVAPHAGAWIEICLATTSNAVMLVAPHAGAWIEILLF